MTTTNWSPVLESWRKVPSGPSQRPSHPSVGSCTALFSGGGELRQPTSETSIAKIPAANHAFAMNTSSFKDCVVAPQPAFAEQLSHFPRTPKSTTPRQRIPAGCVFPILGWTPQKTTPPHRSHLRPPRRAKNGSAVGQELRTRQKSR